MSPTTLPAAAPTASYREPYVDTLPNGTQCVRLDSAEETGPAIVALYPINGDDPATDAIISANVRLHAAAPELRDALDRCRQVLALAARQAGDAAASMGFDAADDELWNEGGEGYEAAAAARALLARLEGSPDGR